jgi:hypothetical protein
MMQALDCDPPRGNETKALPWADMNQAFGLLNSLRKQKFRRQERRKLTTPGATPKL